MKNDEVLVEVQDVSKRFCKDFKRSIRYGFMDSLRALAGKNMDATTLRNDEFWAVKDISFELRRGECLGLIGHNGAGKSTLLKMLNGLIRPDHGKIIMRGRIGALIELGAGFNPILTGRENIYNNAAVLGFSRAETDKKFEEIVAFAEIGEFLDMPVQNYSSGMKVRLGFAIAAQMEPDVLLIDEVLAVGDVGFRIKCYNKIYDLLPHTAIIFVSHSMVQVAKISTEFMLLEKGMNILSGSDIGTGVQEYFKKFDAKEDSTKNEGKVRINAIKIAGTHQNETIQYLDELSIEIDFVNESGENNFSLDVAIEDKEMKVVAISYISNFSLIKGNSKKVLRINQLPLTMGIYVVNLSIREKAQKEGKEGKVISYYRNITSLNINGGNIIKFCAIQLKGVIDDYAL